MPTNSPASHEGSHNSFSNLRNRAFRQGREATAEAIRLSDSVAHTRNHAVQLVVRELASVEELVDTTALERTEQASDAQRFQKKYGTSDSRTQRLAHIVTLQSIFLDHMVLTPALFAYGPHNQEARDFRKALDVGLYEALGEHAMQFIPKKVYTSEIERAGQTASIREVMLLALGARSENPDAQVIPALFGDINQNAHAEFFTYSNVGTVQHAAIHLTSTTETIPGDLPNMVAFTNRDLGLGATGNPWRDIRVGNSSLVALQKEHQGEASTRMGPHNITIGGGLDSVEQNVMSVLRGSLTLYDLEEPVAPPV